MSESELAKWVRQAEDNSGGWQRCQLLLSEAAAELRHASIFIRSREKMHPDGVKLYDDLLARIEAEL